MPNPFPAIHYHSLIIETEGLQCCLEITAKTHEGIIMGVRNRDYLVEGVQFHCESIVTELGHNLLANLLGFASLELKVILWLITKSKTIFFPYWSLCP
jgi:anthranilate/para-aminobenzoate synthase component II